MSSGTAAADDRALGTAIRVVVTDPGALAVAKAAVDRVLEAVDASCSRFRDDSELSRLNRSGGSVQVSELLAQALDAALTGAELSDGAVDPTVGMAVRIAGYDRDFGLIDADAGPLHLTAQAVPGWRVLQFDRSQRVVTIPRGVALDLGATAKALAADLAAAAAFDALHGRGGVLVSLGGDIAIAGTPPEGGWIIQLSDRSDAPLDPAAARIALHSGAVASSSTTVRRWRRGGVEMHHIIDPRTSLPAATPWRLATVLAARCVAANVAATTAIVRGDDAPQWLQDHGFAARLVRTDGEVVRIGGWPEGTTK